jgi:hypothetical protein
MKDSVTEIMSAAEVAEILGCDRETAAVLR